MYYALRRRIGEQEPILLYQGQSSYLFCHAGVLDVPNDQRFLFNERIWIIVDSFNARNGIPEHMSTLAANLFPIYLSSPKQERWRNADQFYFTRVAIMNPWSEEEISYV
jgi:hypothetical protein